MAAQDNKQKSVIESIESANAADEYSTTVTSNSTNETEGCKEMNLELSLGGWYSKSKSSNQGGPKFGIGESSKSNRPDIRYPPFLRAIGIYNSQTFRMRLYQGLGSSASPTYPDTNLTLGSIPPPSSGVLAMTLLESFLPRFIKGTPEFFSPPPFKNLADGASTYKDLVETASKRARTEDEEGQCNVVPRVMTDGGNPNGVRIQGFLGKYSNDQVYICCACHHKVLTPGEFVRHAGGEDVENPGQLIKVVFEVEE